MFLRALVICALLVQQLVLPGLDIARMRACAEGSTIARTCCSFDSAGNESAPCACRPSVCGCEGQEQDEPAPAAPAPRDRQTEQVLFLLTLPIGACPSTPKIEREVVAAPRNGLSPVGGARHQAALCIWRT